ncbi:MAG: hypothetical protein JXB32_23015 [Deltaproteobacteria bacterium]|nr:hypothetical protein [Deltaproteobacteria bacterium]
MGPSSLRWIFILGFLAACVAFGLGRRRLRRVRTAHTPWEALRLAYALSLALLVGCSSGPRAGAGTTPATDGDAGTGGSTTTTATAGVTTGLGVEADALWSELVALWDEAGTYRAGEVETATLATARGRLDGLLARLAGLDRVTADAPGLVALLRVEFQARLDVMPAEVDCYEPMPVRTSEAEAWERLAARVEALEELAGKGYVNGWLREHVLERLREDAAAVRAGLAAGDAWRTEDYAMRQRDPAEATAVLERAEAALRTLEGR